MVVHTCNSSIWKVEAEISHKVEDNLDYTARPYLQSKKQNNKNFKIILKDRN